MKILISILLLTAVKTMAQDTIKLEWSKSHNAAGYVIETFLDDKSISINKDVGNRTNYNLTLPSGANYLIRITPYNKDNMSGVSSDYIKYIGIKEVKPAKMNKIVLKIVK